MKRTLTGCFLVIAILCFSACSKSDLSNQKQDIKSTENKLVTTPPVIGQIDPNQIEVDLVQVSPGIWKTAINYFGAELTFKNIRLYGGYAYAEFVSAKMGGSNLNILTGDPYNRIFSFSQAYCTTTFEKTEKTQTYYEFKATLPNGTTYMQTRDGLQSGINFILNNYSTFVNLGEINFRVTPKTYKYTRLEIMNMNCSNNYVATGKIIGILQPDYTVKYKVVNVSFLDQPCLIPV